MFQPELISAKMLDSYVGRPDAVLIDLRDPDLYSHGHIRGARNYPFEQLEETVPFPKGKILVFYCEHGIASAKAAKLFSRKGYETRSVIGGILAYHGRNLVIFEKS